MRVAIALIVVALAACTRASQIGPYVKHISRNGDWLVVHKCMIVLDGESLSESSCTTEQLPLRSTQVPPPLQGPPPPMPPPAAR